MKKKILFLTEVVFFLVITVLFFAPLEMFLTNQEEFWFSLSDIIGIITMVTLGVFLIIFLIGILLKGKLFNNYVALVFSGALLLYLQGNFMNLDLGVMNGAEIIWSNYQVNFIVNFIIWLMGIAGILLLANKKWNMMEKVIKYTSIIFTLMQISTVVILIATTPKYDHAVNRVITDKDVFNVSEEENIIVFLLDMYDDTYFQRILKDEPQLEQELEGFTYFSNSVGSHNTTSYSSATLFTGEYLYNEAAFYTQYDKMFLKAPMFPNLKENGYVIDIYMDLCLPHGIYSYMDNYVEGKNVICSNIGFIKRMYMLVACKYFPNIVKPYIWMNGTEFEILKEYEMPEFDSWSSNNMVFYEKLEKNEITTDKQGKNFKFIYLDGAHYPYYHDENLNPISENYDTDIASARGALRVVQKYLDKLKEKDAYDNTAIVLIADHGYYWDGVLTNPLLLVKPMNERGKLKISNAPVCHKDFQASVLSLAGLNDNMQFGKSYFDIEEGEERERLFYQYNLSEKNTEGNYRLIEYTVDSVDNKRENFHLTDVEYSATGEKTTHKDKCEFCLSGEEIPVETEENWPLIYMH